MTTSASAQSRRITRTPAFDGWKELGYSDWGAITDTSATFLAHFAALESPAIAWISRRETITYAGFMWWLSRVGDIPVSIIELPDLSIMKEESLAPFLDRSVPLSPQDRAFYRAQWEQLKIEDAPLRVIDGNHMVSAPIDCFDDTLLRHATFHWQRMVGMVGATLVELMDAGFYQISDLILSTRLANLARAGKLESRGDLSNMLCCELRLPPAH